MLDYSEEDIKNAAELRDWLLKQISDKQEEIERLRSLLHMIDNLLKQESFKTASVLERSLSVHSPKVSNTSKQFNSKTTSIQSDTQSLAPYREPTSISHDGQHTQSITDKPETDENFEIRELKRLKDNFLLANVTISQKNIEIIPETNLNLHVNTPPFKTFFLQRILDGMINRDKDKLKQKQISDEDIFSYTIEDHDGYIQKIVINNYKEKEHLTDILNTSVWVFTRMLEKSSENKI